MVMTITTPPPISGLSWDRSSDGDQARQREGRRYDTTIHGALPEVAAAQWSGGTGYVFKLPILNGRRPSRSASVTVDEVFVMLSFLPNRRFFDG